MELAVISNFHHTERLNSRTVDLKLEAPVTYKLTVYFAQSPTVSATFAYTCVCCKIWTTYSAILASVLLAKCILIRKKNNHNKKNRDDLLLLIL